MRCPQFSLKWFCVLVTLVACGGGSEIAPSAKRTREAALQSDDTARNYPEAVLIDADPILCSGALIAPRVVVTSSRCLLGTRSLRVRAPYALGQSSEALTGRAFAPDAPDGALHEVAVLELSKPIALLNYPSIPLPANPYSAVGARKVGVQVGRSHRGSISPNDLYAAPLYVEPGGFLGLGNGWNGFDPVDSTLPPPGDDADIGGPVFLDGPAPHTLIGITGEVDGVVQRVPRVDKVHDWLQARVAESGGFEVTPPSESELPVPRDPARLQVGSGGCQSAPGDVTGVTLLLSVFWWARRRRRPDQGVARPKINVCGA